MKRVDSVYNWLDIEIEQLVLLVIGNIDVEENMPKLIKLRKLKAKLKRV
jgi:hypothetical protein